MKHSNFLPPFLFALSFLLTGGLAKLLSNYGQDLFYLSICQNDTYDETSFPLNYRGPSLTSHFNDDSTDLVLCPGDTFGDLNETYVTLHYCYFAIYHQGKEIGSFGRTEDEKVRFCAGSLEKDGNLVLYKQINTNDFQDDGIRDFIRPDWNSETASSPKKSELRIQNKQLQLVHTFQDGNERIFYTGENIRGFREEMGVPRQVAEKFLLKNHSDTDNVILKRNEYIGDLNGMHLILQTNCELELKNFNQTIWSFALDFRPDEKCTLYASTTGISIYMVRLTEITKYSGISFFPASWNSKVLQSKIAFKEDQLIIIQTLEDGSEVIFHSEPGQDIGLKLIKEPRQIAINKITISTKTIIERMDYIGDLDGLHLMLQDDCAFMLADGQEELWKSKESLDRSFMECNVEINTDGTIWLNRFKNGYDRTDNSVQIFGQIKKKWETKTLPSQFKLSLENNMMVLSLKYRFKGNSIDTYHAGVKTNGIWFQQLSGHSLFNDNKDNKISPELGYIGHLDGVHVVLNKKGNWILFNNTQVKWESGTAQENESGFVLNLIKDGNVALSEKQSGKTIWSTETANYYKEAKISQSELFVNNDGLWLNNIYVNGVIKRFKALEGTNNFVVLPDEEDEFRRSPF